MIGVRVRKTRILRYKAAVVLQSLQRGRISRKLDTRLKRQALLVRDWLSSFKQERVSALMDAKESKKFYLQVESNFSTKKRMERHKKTNVSDLPKPIREGPLFDHNVIPDYAALAHKVGFFFFFSRLACWCYCCLFYISCLLSFFSKKNHFVLIFFLFLMKDFIYLNIISSFPSL